MPQPAKGVRALIGSRVPPEHKQAYVDAAARHGLELSDYLAVCLAALHDLEPPAWIRGKKGDPEQQELPLRATASPGRSKPRLDDQEMPLTKAS
jgi:hypothetical protein